MVEQICQELIAYALSDAVVPNEIAPTPYSRAQLREKIVAMEAAAFAGEKTGAVQTCDMDETFPLRHIFAPGVYAREMNLPAGHWAIGKIHKHAHLSFITKGRIAVLTEDGPVVYVAPYAFVSTPGAKRVVLAIDDTTWTTVHVTEKTDLKDIEADVIAKSFDDLGIIEIEGE